jgi:hypothetical protein
MKNLLGVLFKRLSLSFKKTSRNFLEFLDKLETLTRLSLLKGNGNAGRHSLVTAPPLPRQVLATRTCAPGEERWKT